MNNVHYTSITQCTLVLHNIQCIGHSYIVYISKVYCITYIIHYLYTISLCLIFSIAHFLHNLHINMIYNIYNIIYV